MRVKVLHLIKSLGRGGAEMLLPETISHHNRSDFEFYCVYFLPWKNQMVPSLLTAGVQVECFEAGNTLAMIMRVPRIIRFIKSNKIDLVHCHLPWAGIVGRLVHRLSGVPVIYTEHNKQERYHFVTRRLNLLTLGWNNQVVAVSDDVAASVKAFKGNAFKIKTILNGINPGKYNPASMSKATARSLLNLPAGGPVIGNVCVFRVQKRLPSWLQAAAEISKSIPTVQFILVGDGPVKEEVHHLVRNLGLQHRILLPGLQEDVRPYLAAMDLFMITSEFEGLPLALLEAMSMEVPVVATAAGGIPEVIQDGESGFVVPVEDPGKVAGIAIELLQDEARRAAVGKAGRQRVMEKYSIQHMVQELEETYIETVRQSKVETAS